MASYRLFLTESAARELRGAAFPFRRQVNQHLSRLRDEPRPAEAQHLEGERYRWRTLGWTILYEIEDDQGSVTVVAIRS